MWLHLHGILAKGAQEDQTTDQPHRAGDDVGKTDFCSKGNTGVDCNSGFICYCKFIHLSMHCQINICQKHQIIYLT